MGYSISFYPQEKEAIQSVNVDKILLNIDSIKPSEYNLENLYKGTFTFPFIVKSRTNTEEYDE